MGEVGERWMRKRKRKVNQAEDLNPHLCVIAAKSGRGEDKLKLITSHFVSVLCRFHAHFNVQMRFKTEPAY